MLKIDEYPGREEGIRSKEGNLPVKN